MVENNTSKNYPSGSYNDSEETFPINKKQK